METKTKSNKTTSTKTKAKTVKENAVANVSAESSVIEASTIEKPIVSKKANPLRSIKADTIQLQRNRPYKITLAEDVKYAVIKNLGGGDLVIEDGVRRVLYFGETAKIDKEVTISAFSYPTISITYWG